MRAARLLQLLLLLQNRGRLTSAQLASELEVSSRTILRDVDAMTEAGLPIIVYQGNQGGIELGFNYRTRLTGLAQDEAEVLGLILAAPSPLVSALGAEDAARRARAKLVESLPDKSRAAAKRMSETFTVTGDGRQHDPRIKAMAHAVRNRLKVRLRFSTLGENAIHPTAMRLDGADWAVRDGRVDHWVPLSDWGRVNVSALQF